MRVRLFAGLDFQPGDQLVPDFAGLGYTRGVPMGGRLNAPPKGAAPLLSCGQCAIRTSTRASERSTMSA